METCMARHHLLSGVLAGALLLIAVPSMAQEDRSGSRRPCLRQGFIHDFQLVPGNRSIVVIDRARTRFRVNFMGTCFNLQHEFMPRGPHGLRFRTFGVGRLSCIARGDSLLLRNTRANGGRCTIREVQYQTAEMDLADREAGRGRRSARR